MSSAILIPWYVSNSSKLCMFHALNNNSFCRLLSNFPVLSDLTLEEKFSDVLLILDIAKPSLQRLLIITKVKGSTHLCSLLNNYIRKLAPSFKYFNILELLYTYTRFCSRVRLRYPSKLEDASIFGRSGEILVDLLLRSIKLVVLKLNNVKNLAPLGRWDPPSSVPECLLSNLEALEWRGYTGRVRDKKLVSYLLNHALCLKTAKIVSEPYDWEDKQQIVEDFASMPRASTSCELVLK